MTEKIVRHYNLEDEVMITRAGVQKGNLQTDLALFTLKRNRQVAKLLDYI